MTDYKGYDIDRLSESINNKADRDLSNVVGCDVVVEYKTPTELDPTWYRLYKSGWCEQGGLFHSSSTAGGTINTITLMKEMTNSSYTVLLGLGDDASSNTNVYTWHTARTPTSVNIMTNLVGTTVGTCWEVKGMAKVS